MKPRNIQLILLFTVFTIGAFAQAGKLDATFGNNGMVMTKVSDGSAMPYAVAVQADGKIIAAGRVTSGKEYLEDWVLVRYKPNGSLDATFGNAGIVHSDLGSKSEEARAILIQPDGKILVGGETQVGKANDFAMVRYNEDGSPDQNFGNAGIVIVSTSKGDDEIYSMALQPDGKIVAAGVSDFGNNDEFALMRFNTDGSADKNFGKAGVVTTDFGYWCDATSVLIQPDGKIIAVGNFAKPDSNNTTISAFALARYEVDGKLDKSFGIGGKLTTEIGVLGSKATSAVLQSDGKIIAAGLTNQKFAKYQLSNVALVRYNVDGTLDLTFGDNGIAITPSVSGKERCSANAIALEKNGELVVVGDNFPASCYHVNGTLDDEFGNKGRALNNEESEVALAVAIQPDGNIVTTCCGYHGEFILARYLCGKISENGIPLQKSNPESLTP